jgi:hypothetical protein
VILPVEVGESLSVVPILPPIELRASSIDTSCQGGEGGGDHRQNDSHLMDNDDDNTNRDDNDVNER